MNFLDFLGEDKPEEYYNKILIDLEEMTEIPKELKNCKCCERHKQSFPTLGCSLPKFINKDKNENVCKCPCRHIARHICRSWDDLHEVEELNSEDTEDTEDTEDSEDSEDSEDPEYSEDSEGSLKDFIVKDDGLNKKERKELDKVLRRI